VFNKLSSVQNRPIVIPDSLVLFQKYSPVEKSWKYLYNSINVRSIYYTWTICIFAYYVIFIYLNGCQVDASQGSEEMVEHLSEKVLYQEEQIQQLEEEKNDLASTMSFVSATCTEHL